ncbi:MAG TPA: type II toxin-antitoxin system HipA family toxin [Treponema sp.]|nr:type II toxin-antitoxin system HipA family toxin [Treponema sp.]
MSAYPVLAHGNEKIPAEKLKMAMAVTGTNRHYTWSKIQGRHWKETASRYGSVNLIDEVLTEILKIMSQSIETVSNSLPPEFPEQLALSIFNGIRSTVERL